MKKRLISLILVVCMLIPACITVTAAEIRMSDAESEIAERIEKIVALSYSDFSGQYEIGNAICIFNADTVCMYYLIPIFRNQVCVGTIELDENGNVTLTDETALYRNIEALDAPAYFLYTTGGIVYAEQLENTAKLYDSGLCILENGNFTDLSYADKIALAKTYVETAISCFDINAVIAKTEFCNIARTDVLPLTEVPTLETEECAITNFVYQGSYNICWAACVATIVNYKKGYSLTAGNVATKMGHNYTADDYAGASLSETVSALSRYGLTYGSSGKLSWSNVKSRINADQPFIVCIEEGSINAGHMLTGYGYSCQYGDSEVDADSRYLQVWDPNGAKRSFSYYASSYSLYGYSWTWTYTIVD